VRTRTVETALTTTATRDELTNTERLTDESEFTLGAHFDTKLSELDDWT
jgi:hypothetical protein